MNASVLDSLGLRGLFGCSGSSASSGMASEMTCLISVMLGMRRMLLLDETRDGGPELGPELPAGTSPLIRSTCALKKPSSCPRFIETADRIARTPCEYSVGVATAANALRREAAESSGEIDWRRQPAAPGGRAVPGLKGRCRVGWVFSGARGVRARSGMGALAKGTARSVDRAHGRAGQAGAGSPVVGVERGHDLGLRRRDEDGARRSLARHRERAEGAPIGDFGDVRVHGMVPGVWRRQLLRRIVGEEPLLDIGDWAAERHVQQLRRR
eukprot:7019700-Prymnesium_polylepis.1